LSPQPNPAAAVPQSASQVVLEPDAEAAEPEAGAGPEDEAGAGAVSGAGAEAEDGAPTEDSWMDNSAEPQPQQWDDSADPDYPETLCPVCGKPPGVNVRCAH